jgi:hypothetical protein
MAVYQFKGTDTIISAPQCGCTNLQYKEDIGAFECVVHGNSIELDRVTQEAIIEVIHEQVVTNLVSMED